MDLYMTFLILFGTVLLKSSFTNSSSNGLFTKPGLPACFASPHSSTQDSKLFTFCENHCHSPNGIQYKLYCSSDHACCYESHGCARCCRKRDDVNEREVAGVVIGVTIFVFIMIAVAAFLSVKFCSRERRD